MATTERAIRPGADWQRAGDYEDIRYETAEGIAKITIDRPEVRNAFRPQTLIEISDALERAREDTDVGVIVLTGEGPLAFCSGGDQSVRGDTGYVPQGAAVGRFHVTDLHVQMRRLPKPVVAMVAGYAIGGGHVLHVVCDLTIAADNARFGQTGPKVGSFDGGFGAGLLAGQVGQKKAKEIWFLCRQYDAAGGARHGPREHRRPARGPRGGDGALVPRDARAVAVRAAPAEGQLQRRPRTGSPASSSSPTTPTSSSTRARRPRRAARPTRRSGSRTSASSRSRPVSHLQALARRGAAAHAAGRGRARARGHRAGAAPRTCSSRSRFAAALVGSIFIQIGTNLANDYSDARRGADTEDRLGPVRVTAGGLMPPRRVLIGTWVAFGDRRGGRRLPGRGGGLGAARGRRRCRSLAGVLYTGGPRPYGYEGLGELFVFLFFGVVAVVGSYFVQTEDLRWEAFALGVPVGPAGGRDPRGQQRARRRDRPPRGQADARGAARARARRRAVRRDARARVPSRCP